MIWIVVIASAVILIIAITLAVIFSIFRKSFTRLPPEKNAAFTADSNELVSKSLSSENAKRIAEGIAWVHSRDCEHIYITSFDGLKLHAKLLKNPIPSGRIMLLAHGYHSFPEYDFSCAFRLYYNLGYDMLLIDQRTHGESEGKYITFGVRERYDILKWCEYLDGRFGKDRRIVLGGISMGCTAVLLAAGLPSLPDSVIGIVADCGFTSPYYEFAHVMKHSMHIPVFPFLDIASAISKSVMGFGFRDCTTVDAVKKTHLPILFIHGEDDTFVPPENTIINYDACISRKELILVPDAGHGLSFLVDERLCTEKLIDFLDSL